MTTLNLTKQSKGYYSKRIGDIEIKVSEWGGKWEGLIHDWSKDDNSFTVYECFADTKREVYSQIVNELTK